MNDFEMHVVISKGLRRQKCTQKRKRMRKKEVQEREETVYQSVFIHLNFFTKLLPFIT